MDHFTRYAAAYVMPKQTASVVANVLWENFLVNYGWPEKILADQGKNFESSLVRELCELAGVQKLRSTPYHPKTNGQCEVQHRDAKDQEGIKILHWNMLYPIETVKNDEQDSTTGSPKKRVKALVKANLLMDLHFADV